jgi:SAM-dependent methyltransferase
MSHTDANRAYWDDRSDAYVAEVWERYKDPKLCWGLFRIAESELRMLGDVAGKDVLDFGCGAAYQSCRVARLGGRIVGLDVSPRQLANARRLQEELGLEFPLVEASGEDVPLPDAAFDIVFSEYGAVLWCDPYLWVPEAVRLLRPGGLLAFLTSSPLQDVCYEERAELVVPRLVRPSFGLHRIDETDGTTTFNLPYGEWIRLAGEHGLALEDLIELRPAEDAADWRWTHMPREWARQWPAEVVWKFRKGA